MDVSGEHQLDIAHSVFKRRLTFEGKVIEEEATQYQIGGEDDDEDGEEEGEVIMEKKECLRSYPAVASFPGLPTFSPQSKKVSKPGNEANLQYKCSTTKHCFYVVVYMKTSFISSMLCKANP